MDLASVLRREAFRTERELKAYLVVHFGFAPAAAADLARDPVAAAARLEALMADVERFMHMPGGS